MQHGDHIAHAAKVDNAAVLVNTTLGRRRVPPFLGSLSLRQKWLNVGSQEFDHLMWFETAQILLNDPKCGLPRLFDQTLARNLYILSILCLVILLLNDFTSEEEAFVEDLRNETHGLRNFSKLRPHAFDWSQLLDNCLDQF